MGATGRKQTHPQVVRAWQVQDQGAGPGLGDKGTAFWEEEPPGDKKQPGPVWGEREAASTKRRQGAARGHHPAVPRLAGAHWGLRPAPGAWSSAQVPAAPQALPAPTSCPLTPLRVSQQATQSKCRENWSGWAGHLGSSPLGLLPGPQFPLISRTTDPASARRW